MNVDCDIAASPAGATVVTVYPAADSSDASGALDSPFTSTTSTFPDTAACAAGAAARATTAAPAVTAAAEASDADACGRGFARGGRLRGGCARPGGRAESLTRRIAPRQDRTAPRTGYPVCGAVRYNS